MLSNEQSSRRRLVFAAVAASVALVALLMVVCRRADITDPDMLEKAPPDYLRQPEIETLIVAAFRNATQVTIDSEVPVPLEVSSRPKYRSLAVVDRYTLESLAASFRAPKANEPTPIYVPYPGVLYVRVTFDGPYRPDFWFAGTSVIYVHDKGTMMAGAPFVRKIAELLDLEEYVRPE